MGNCDIVILILYEVGIGLAWLSDFFTVAQRSSLSPELLLSQVAEIQMFS